MSDMFSSLIGLIELFLVCGVAALGLLVILTIVAARLPPDNPLKRILHALCVRITAMLGVGAVAIPIQPIPGLDVAYDAGALVLGVYLAFTFLKELKSIWEDTHRPVTTNAGRADYRPGVAGYIGPKSRAARSPNSIDMKN